MNLTPDLDNGWTPVIECLAKEFGYTPEEMLDHMVRSGLGVFGMQVSGSVRARIMELLLPINERQAGNRT